jgi:hypothetical protein
MNHAPMLAKRQTPGNRKPRNFTFRSILIHVNGVDDAVGEAGYFDAIIDFGELWG